MKPYYEHAGITIYHGDCREILPTLEPASVDMMWTDPPYGHNNHDGDFNARLNEHRGLKNKPIANDSQDTMREVVDFALAEATKFLKPDCCCCCCCGGGGPRPTFAWLAERMDRSGLSFFHSVIWDKVNPGIGWRYRRRHEMVMVAHREGGRLSWNEEEPAVANILSVSKPRDAQHPNEKPIELVAGFIQRHTLPGQIVIDPFMGRGTTLRAAKDLGRRAIGIELEERWCEQTAKRLAQEVLPL
jgi:site-specific DNA-methyltransferase (adenine-specific)